MTGRYSNVVKVTGRHNNVLRVKSNREAATMFSTGLEMAEVNANQASGARSAGKGRALTPVAGAVRVVATGAKAGAKTGGKLANKP